MKELRLTMMAAALMLVSAGCRQTDPVTTVPPVVPPAKQDAPAPLTDEQRYRAHFALQPRYLFGCGIRWAQWRWPGRREWWPYDGRCMDAIRAMGGNAVPINIPWHDVEPEPGRWYFDYVDHQVAEAEKRGLAMFAYMGLTPDWALPPEAPQDKPGIGYRFPPPDEREDQFVTYCRKVARRYRDRIGHYQFWNEPNGCSWVNDGCANGHVQALYTRWLRTWYTAMKAEDPDAVLAVGGLDYHEGVAGHKYIEGMYREGAADHFDAIAIHPYGISTPLYERAIEDTRRVMVEHGDGDKGIWIREYGWALDDEQEKSRRITATFELLNDPRYYYVTMAMYLCLTDPDGRTRFGLCDDDLTPRPSYHAFARAAARDRATPTE